MAQKRNETQTLSDALASQAGDLLTDLQKMRIEKNKYLLENESDILTAIKVGYPYNVIAEVATVELLKRGVPSSFTFKNKEGGEKVKETKFSAADIKNFYKMAKETDVEE